MQVASFGFFILILAKVKYKRMQNLAILVPKGVFFPRVNNLCKSLVTNMTVN